jgi:hypothetical protein
MNRKAASLLLISYSKLKEVDICNYLIITLLCLFMKRCKTVPGGAMVLSRLDTKDEPPRPFCTNTALRSRSLLEHPEAAPMRQGFRAQCEPQLLGEGNINNTSRGLCKFYFYPRGNGKFIKA